MSKVKLLLYCTKGKPYLRDYRGKAIFNRFVISPTDRPFTSDDYQPILNGKIVAECDCEKVEEISCRCVPYRNKNNLGYELFIDNGVYKVEWKENINLVNEEKKYNNPENYKDEGVVFERSDRYIDTMFKNKDLKQMCLSPQQLLDYLKLGNKGYALHLSNVNKFDKPYQLDDFFLLGKNGNVHVLEKAPQNMCNVSIRYGSIKNDELIKNKYILISIRPEWLCKILNGEKTIEVRRVVTNKLKKLIGE